jgi:hypothetical protein
MLTFQDFLNEGAGSLAGMPQPFIKALTNWKLGGENSKIELYKTSAKQKDLTSALKHIGGYVKPEDKGRKTYSPEKEAAARTKEYAGVAIKVDGEWAFIGEFDEYDNKYRLFTINDYRGFGFRFNDHYNKNGHSFSIELYKIDENKRIGFLDQLREKLEVVL